jgi:hypothetical protein
MRGDSLTRDLTQNVLQFYEPALKIYSLSSGQKRRQPDCWMRTQWATWTLSFHLANG